MAYIGRDIQYGTLDKQSFTANGSTKIFTLNSGVKDAKSLLVVLNGVIQEPEVAYTASGTTLTFVTAPTNGHVLYVIYLGKELSVGASRENITYQTGTGNNSTTPLTLSTTPYNASAIMVMLNGVTQRPVTDYTVSGTTLTFTSAVATGVNILVYHLGSQSAIGTINNNAVTDAKIVSMNASKLTGSLPSSMAVDTTKIDQTISALGLHIGVADNKVSYNLPGSFIDTFEGDDGILTETTVDRNASEYVSTTVGATTNATGTLVSKASTAASTVSTASGVMLYEDYEGTGTLGTDLKVYFSSNDGTNWTEAASYGAATTFIGSTKMVKLGKTTIANTGTAVKMKAEWANQAAGVGGDPGNYSNSYSTGNRGSIITATDSGGMFGNGSTSNMINGTTTSFNNYLANQTIDSSKYLRWQFDEARVVTEARWWNDEDDDGAFGTWQWQGSNDGSSWTDIGATFEINNLQLVGSAAGALTSYQELTTLSGNTTAYTYYQMKGVSGSTTTNSNHVEIEFKCNAIPGTGGKVQRLHGWAVNY